MTILQVLLGLLFILVLLRLLFSPRIEGFQDAQQLDPSTVKSYDDFLDFYTSFCSNWDKAIQSSVASELPQQPLTDPSQTQSSSSPQITDSQKNQYITQLSQQLSQPLPPICTQLPPNIDSSSLSQVSSLMPQSPQPYLNALNWMNQKMEQSHSNLNGALQGGSAPAQEGFEDTCQDLSQCIANNPQLAKQIADEIAQQNTQTIQQQEQTLVNLINSFLNNSDLMSASNNNKQLAQKSQDIQNQAQSGQMVNQVNVPGGNTKTTYTKPEGSDKLTKMKQDDPQKYNQLQQNNTQLFTIKTLLDQINGGL